MYWTIFLSSILQNTNSNHQKMSVQDHFLHTPPSQATNLLTRRDQRGTRRKPVFSARFDPRDHGSGSSPGTSRRDQTLEGLAQAPPTRPCAPFQRGSNASRSSLGRRLAAGRAHVTPCSSPSPVRAERFVSCRTPTGLQMQQRQVCAVCDTAQRSSQYHSVQLSIPHSPAPLLESNMDTGR